MSLFAEMNGVYAKYFDGDFPARSAVAVKGFAEGSFSGKLNVLLSDNLSIYIECVVIQDVADASPG